MRSQIRALAWEELRVGGSIAAVVVVCSFLMQSLFFYTETSSADSDAFMFMIVPGPLVLLALLLVLNPDYSGHMTAGFSRRVLRLPVPVALSVGVSLIARFLLLGATALAVITFGREFFDKAPGYDMVMAVLTFFLLIQAIDWIRAYVSGLTSGLWLAAICVFGYVLANGRDSNAMTLLSGPSTDLSGLLLILSMLLSTYIVAVPIVNATRRGRSIGIPEIWEWPGLTSLPTVFNRPFQSPIGAQVWFELRRAGWILPAGALFVTALASMNSWLSWAQSSWSLDVENVHGTLLGLWPYIGVLLAAVAQGAVGSVAEFRRKGGQLEFQYLRPLTDADFARARAIANAISLTTALLPILFLQLWIPGQSMAPSILAMAHEYGLASYRDIARVLLFRTLIVGLVAWAALALSSRTGIALAIVGIAVFLGGGMIAAYSDAIVGADVMLAFWVVLLVSIPFAHTIEWHRALTSTRSYVMYWMAWGMVTWLVFGAALPAISGAATTATHWSIALVSCAGLASMIGLPFVSFAYDIRLKRHESRSGQDRDQHQYASRRALWPAWMRLAFVGCATIFILWIGWPVPTTFESVWRTRGWPTTLAELESWYEPVPTDSNAAEKYLAIATNHAERETMFRQQRRELMTVDPAAYDPEGYPGKVLVHGQVDVPRNGSIDSDVWAITTEYREVVTRDTANELIDAANNRWDRSRYPIELSLGYYAELGHLGSIRDMARELRLEALFRALESNSADTSDCVSGIRELSKSLKDEPVLISQFLRMGLLSIAVNSIEDALNFSQPDSHSLRRIGNELDHALPPIDEGAALNRGMIGESVLALSTLRTRPATRFDPQVSVARQIPFFPLDALLSPTSAEMIAASLSYEYMFRSDPFDVSAIEELDRKVNDLIMSSRGVAPLTSILIPALASSYRVEVRTRTELDLARVAIAVERFRLANEVLPENLDSLVPEYLPEVPRDLFSPRNDPIQFVPGDDFAYIVYSFGLDHEDGGGREDDESAQEGDIVFVVTSLATRLGPHILPAEASSTAD